jgi:regulator of replication initiation timing
MTSVLQLSNPIVHYKSCYSLNNNLPFSFAMSTPSKPVVQEGYSSADSESKKKQASTPGAKRRPSRAGTRSVTTLTAAQLERKRANDREAQRAIRQRTKDHIESLERRIAELTSNHDNQRLLEVMQRNDQLEQENAMLRDRLNHTLGYVSENPGMSSSLSSLCYPEIPFLLVSMAWRCSFFAFPARPAIQGSAKPSKSLHKDVVFALGLTRVIFALQWQFHRLIQV